MEDSGKGHHLDDCQMSLRLQVTTDEGESLTLTVLIDTGAQVNLVRKGLFNHASSRPANRPVALRTVGGEILPGGDRTQRLSLHFVARDYGHNVPYKYVAQDNFYVAEMDDCDVILGYPFLCGRQMSPILHRRKILWERAKKWTWLTGDEAKIGGVKSERSKSLGLPKGQRPKPKMWISHDYAVKEDFVQKIVQHFGGNVPSVDAFASKDNCRFPKFWDAQVDAFKKDWGKERLLWINPPFETLEEVVNKIIEYKALAIIVVPEWPRRRWWQKLQRIKLEEYKFEPKEKIFLRGGTELMKPPRFQTWAMLVYGGLNRHSQVSLRKIVAHNLRALPEGRPDSLTGVELDIVEACIGKYDPSFGVRSVVKVPQKSNDTNSAVLAIEKAKRLLLAEFSHDVLSGKLPKDPPVRGPFGMAKIELIPGAMPKRHRSFKMVGEREEALKLILEDYVKRGWLEPSYSEWGSPCFVVPKKQAGEWRLVVDYRALNEVTLHDSYELPLIADLLQKQSKKRMFTVLDMKKGYHKMPLDPKSRPCTAMTSHVGLLQ